MIRHLTVEKKPGRVVVLGASGFVGQAISVGIRGSGSEVSALSSADIDLTQPESIDALGRTVGAHDSLVIVSAITPDKGKDAATLMRNLTMGQHLSAFLDQAKRAHVVYISSDAVYADEANPVNETSCCDPSSFHGLMHLVRERMFADAARKQGTPYLILRPCSVYGAGDTHNSYGPNRFLRTALKDHQISLFGQGEEKRDHIYIKDLSRLVSLCLARSSEGVLNVATGQSVSFFEVAEKIARVCGDGVEIKGSPRANPVTHRHFDVTSIHKAFPDFVLTSLDDGLAEFLREIKDVQAG